MKKTLAYTLAVALLLSLAACHRPQTDQQTTEPEPPQVQATIPEVETTPEPEPEQTPAAPEKHSDTTPIENEAPQDQTEPAIQEQAEPEQTPEPVEPETPVTAEPTETEPTTTSNNGGGSTQQGGGQQDTGYVDSSGDRDAFVNGLKDVFESQGYVEDRSKGPMTDEDIAWIVGQLNGGSQYQYQGAEPKASDLPDTIKKLMEEQSSGN